MEKKLDSSLTKRVLMKVAYVPLLGKYGWDIG